MEEAAPANQTGRQSDARALQAARNHSIEPAKSQTPSCLTKVVVDINKEYDNERITRESPAAVVKQISHIKNGSHTIPGVDHVFFEKEFEKMEHHAHDSQVVVLAVDSSIPSDIAFKFYVDHVNRPGYVLHVVHHSNFWGQVEPSDGGPSPKHCQDLIVKEDTRVQEVEEKYKKLLAENRIMGEFVVLHGKDTWHDIIQYQEKVHGIMIVMGTRGQNSLRRTFMGSVSDSVVHHASCPVLVCCHPKN